MRRRPRPYRNSKFRRHFPLKICTIRILSSIVLYPRYSPVLALSYLIPLTTYIFNFGNCLKLSGKAVDAASMPLGLFLSSDPAGGAEAVFLLFVECPAAPGAVLGLYPAKLCAAVAISTSDGASSNVIPVHAHKPLPIRVIAEIVYALAEQRIEYGKVALDLCPRSGEVHGLLHCRFRRTIPPRAVSHVCPYFIRIFCQVYRVNLAANGFFGLAEYLPNQHIAIAVLDAVSQYREIVLCPRGIGAAIVSLHGAFF